jgi:hypothetical protein
MTRFDVVVDHEPALVHRAVPNFMIAFAMTNGRAAPCSQLKRTPSSFKDVDIDPTSFPGLSANELDVVLDDKLWRWK